MIEIRPERLCVVAISGGLMGIGRRAVLWFEHDGEQYEIDVTPWTERVEESDLSISMVLLPDARLIRKE